MIATKSLKFKVGIYASLVTLAALIAGALVFLPVVHFHQVRLLDQRLLNDANELLRDLHNFRGAPIDPRRPLQQKFIPLALRDRYLVIEGPEGQILYQSPKLRGELFKEAEDGAVTRQLAGEKCRLYTHTEYPYTIHIGSPLTSIEALERDLRHDILIAAPVVAIVVFLGGLWLARRAVKPVSAITEAAERIGAQNLDERLPIPGTQDEIERLSQVLNRTFDRLQRSYDSVSRFSANASHQLKTPVTVLRTGLDRLAQSPDLDPEAVADVQLLRQQVRRLTAVIDDLLLLAQADAGKLKLAAEEVDVVSLAEAMVDDLSALVEGKDIRVEADVGGPTYVRVDPGRIRLVLQNLAENAAKYTPKNGTIRVTVAPREEHAMIRVANSGEPISAEEREKIFERFRRGSRVGEGIGGHGLGLNIARELARAHGGELSVGPTPEGWNQFELLLPLTTHSGSELTSD